MEKETECYEIMDSKKSKLKWKKGEPPHDGLYIVTCFDFEQKLNVLRIVNRVGYKWMCGNLEVCEHNIKAWCSLNDIEPYKGKQDE